ncbi:phosphoribosylglycinamide formyltransferase [Lentibacillus amyloliquefaciens]|uniref:Phosphoribosylglycinamide formyltransferase n=1 Tax=Lentibacillus amyloliquefaciens TaxID=1472767 RepID=A0A0U4E6Y1_9BACI|nr:phosphoribosylglycinamide formyltransferase [Lentibacillus amyloliquefaciens]ALX49052.1 phosphoribosylglycinamide formyltransferase [Lentibacillus amyloliquefaciens]
MTKVRAAVFASGTGSNFQAIMEADDQLCDIALLVCDKPSAAVIDKAKKFGVPTFIFNPKDFNSKADYERVLLEELRKASVSWIFLAGYMRIVGPVLLSEFPARIVNIHPSLLPDFPGLDAIGQAYEAGADTTGVTVHYIDDGIDTGPIIEQQEVPVYPDDTKEQLTDRVQQVEHKLYPQVIQRLVEANT